VKLSGKSIKSQTRQSARLAKLNKTPSMSQKQIKCGLSAAASV